MAKKKGQSKSASAVKQPFQEKYYVTPGFTVFYLRHKNLTIQYSPRSFGDGAIYFTRNETLNEPSKEDIEITKEQYEEILQAILAELNKLIESDGSYQLTDLLDSFKVCAIRP